MKKVFVAVGLSLSLGAALAHEFWLQPTRFFATVGDQISLQVLVGEHFLGERSEGLKNRIIEYRHHTATGTADLTPALTGDTYGDVSVLLNTSGTHLFSFSNTPKFLNMKADSFLLYLQEDGLDNVIAARQERGDTDKPSRELYQRCVKTLVQVGTETDRTYAKITGMALEIIPDKNPYDQRFGQTAKFQVLFMSKPLEGALVRYWNRDTAIRQEGVAPANRPYREEKARTNALGKVQFRLRPGRNLVSLVHMVPHDEPKAADWHSYWGA